MNLKKYHYFTDSTAEFHTYFKDSPCKAINIDAASCAFYSYAWRKLQLFYFYSEGDSHNSFYSC